MYYIIKRTQKSTFILQVFAALSIIFANFHRRMIPNEKSNLKRLLFLTDIVIDRRGNDNFLSCNLIALKRYNSH